MDASSEAVASTPLTLEDAERAHIIKILIESNGMIGGPQGVAARLAFHGRC